MSEHDAALAQQELAHAEQLLQARNLDQVIESFNKAEAFGANLESCCSGRWQANMLTGNFEAAWLESDTLRAAGSVDPHRFWSGNNIEGRRLILRSLHGLGDAVQMLRYLPSLKRIVDHLILEVPPNLHSFMRDMLEGVEVITWGSKAPLIGPTWDDQIEIMELPYLFRTVTAHLPIAERYLTPSLPKIKQMRQRMGLIKGIRIGITWSAGEWNQKRSTSLPVLASLFDLPADWWSLQGSEHLNELKPYLRNGIVRDANSIAVGIDALTTLIANLDLVITVDTLTAHLAGALGKPVWILLQHAADWRWMLKRESSPWYPSAQLFRMGPVERWDDVIERVRQELKSKVFRRNAL